MNGFLGLNIKGYNDLEWVNPILVEANANRAGFSESFEKVEIFLVDKVLPMVEASCGRDGYIEILATLSNRIGKEFYAVGIQIHCNYTPLEKLVEENKYIISTFVRSIKIHDELQRATEVSE